MEIPPPLPPNQCDKIFECLEWEKNNGGGSNITTTKSEIAAWKRLKVLQF